MQAANNARMKVTGNLRYKNAKGEVIKTVPFVILEPVKTKDQTHVDNRLGTEKGRT